jgi:hypothetical protein
MILMAQSLCFLSSECISSPGFKQDDFNSSHKNLETTSFITDYNWFLLCDFLTTYWCRINPRAILYSLTQEQKSGLIQKKNKNTT